MCGVSSGIRSEVWLVKCERSLKQVISDHTSNDIPPQLILLIWLSPFLCRFVPTFVPNWRLDLQTFRPVNELTSNHGRRKQDEL